MQLNIILSFYIKLDNLFLHKRASAIQPGVLFLTMRFFRRSLSSVQGLKCFLTKNETLAAVRPIFSFIKLRIVVFYHLQQIVISSKNSDDFKLLSDNWCYKCCTFAPCTTEIQVVKTQHELAAMIIIS